MLYTLFNNSNATINEVFEQIEKVYPNNSNIIKFKMLAFKIYSQFEPILYTIETIKHFIEYDFNVCFSFVRKM